MLSEATRASVGIYLVTLNWTFGNDEIATVISEVEIEFTIEEDSPYTIEISEDPCDAAEISFKSDGTDERSFTIESDSS